MTREFQQGEALTAERLNEILATIRDLLVTSDEFVSTQTSAQEALAINAERVAQLTQRKAPVERRLFRITGDGQSDGQYTGKECYTDGTFFEDQNEGGLKWDSGQTSQPRFVDDLIELNGKTGLTPDSTPSDTVRVAFRGVNASGNETWWFVDPGEGGTPLIEAEITAGANPYDWAEVEYDGSGNASQKTNGQSGTGNAYERNGRTNVTSGTIVSLRPITATDGSTIYVFTQANIPEPAEQYHTLVADFNADNELEWFSDWVRAHD